MRKTVKKTKKEQQRKIRQIIKAAGLKIEDINRVKRSVSRNT